MLAQFVRHFYLASFENTDYLQRVNHPFSLEMIVGYHEHFAGVFRDAANARNPGRQFLRRVQIVVAFVSRYGRIIAEPSVLAPPMKTNIAGGRGVFRGRLQRFADDRLIDIAESDLLFPQKSESFWRLPGGVP